MKSKVITWKFNETLFNTSLMFHHLFQVINVFEMI